MRVLSHKKWYNPRPKGRNGDIWRMAAAIARPTEVTRKEFAERVGCSVSALQKIEYGDRRPSVQIAGLKWLD